MEKIFITGVAGFIGRALAESLLNQGFTVIGIDNLNDYYTPQLKLDRLKTLKKYSNFIFEKIDISDEKLLFDFAFNHDFKIIIHLAAQAGVRYSLTNPNVYTQSNLVGMANILELSRQLKKPLIFASSSSIYGHLKETPFKENIQTDFPVSYYAATKKANELMAYSYHHLYKIPIIALRFFTVYGEYGRPDMAAWLFTESILNNKPIQLFNYGELWRDFTYINDIVTGIIELIKIQIHLNPDNKNSSFEVYNIGNHQPVLLKDFVFTLEEILNKKAEKIELPMQEGDVYMTYADTEKLKEKTGFYPKTPLKEGLKNFVNWYKNYHQIQ